MNHFRSTLPRAGERLSRVLAMACLALAIVLPAAMLYGLWTTPAEVLLSRPGALIPSSADHPALPMAAWQTGLVALVGMLPVCAMAYGLLRARLCFLGFVRGEVFSLGTVRHLRGFAAGIFASAVAGLLSSPLASLLMSFGAPAGRRAFALELGSNQVLMMLFAGIVWQIAHVMTRAVEIADDHAQIV